MFTKSIRWRLQLWLGFLLLCVLSGFGLTIYQLQRVNQLKQIDEDLKQRVAALSSAVRGGPPPRGKGHGSFSRGPGPRDFDDGSGDPPPFQDAPGRPPPPMRGPPGEPPRGGPREMHEIRGGPREFRLSFEFANLF